MCKSRYRIRSHISLIWWKIAKFSFHFFYFDPIINLIFALLSWLDLKLKFSGYRILNRWLSYNSQTQVASTVFQKDSFFYLPAGYRIVLVGALSMQNYCFGLTYEWSYLPDNISYPENSWPRRIKNWPIIIVSALPIANFGPNWWSLFQSFKFSVPELSKLL